MVVTVQEPEVRQSPPHDPPAGPPVVAAENLFKVVRATDASARRNRGSTDELVIVDDVSFTIRSGETLGIVGPSGCGKTTLLNMMAGLVFPTAGQLRINGAVVTGPDRRMGYMTARPGLMPWRSAVRNVQFGLEVRGIKGAQARETAMRMLELVDLADFAHWYPFKLSQGMRQRVALARTLAIDPAILLMDEPFAALDVQTKLTLQQQFLALREGTERAVAWVTHDVNEAVSLCDRVIVMSPRPGRIKTEIRIDLDHPRDLATLRFDPVYQQLAEAVWKEFDAAEQEGTT